MDRTAVSQWVESYERSWRSAGTDHLAELFAVDVVYVTSPWAEPITGLDAVARFWEGARDGADEAFSMESEIVAVGGNTAIIRVSVDYVNDPVGRWRDLWVVVLDDDGRCTRFEEWPFRAPKVRPARTH